MTRDNICLVHLVRGANEIGALEQFVTAYRRNEAGIKHDLLVLFKGFSDGDVGLEPHRSILSDLKYKELHLPDGGYDIGSYHAAFHAFHQDYQYFCFLNSFSEPLRAGWLESLFQNAARPGVGIVGATGSYQSLYSDHNYRNFLYARSVSSLKKPILRAAFTCLRFMRFRSFPPFPNPHIRTNGFMLSSAVIEKVNVPIVQNKMDAYCFESGNESLTRQILRMGKKALVVDADGRGYDMDVWYKSNTFRRGRQENLLIADNQTRVYAEGDNTLKVRYSHHAWGHHAWPDLSVLETGFPSDRALSK
jgi:hypothetical protein